VFFAGAQALRCLPLAYKPLIRHPTLLLLLLLLLVVDLVMCSAGAQALRCLALAYKPASKDMGHSLSPLDEAGLTFVAMVAMHDPPRRCALPLSASGSCDT
jgi:hypothetical protein